MMGLFWSVLGIASGAFIAVQAPIMLTAAEQLGVDPSIPIMAVAYGDQWTNMIQPFWALPLLARLEPPRRDEVPAA